MKHNTWQHKRYTGYTALAAAALVLGFYVLLGVFPFGDRMLLTNDLGGQHVNFMAHFAQGGSRAYGFEKGLGGPLSGLFAYYAASPLNVLLRLFPLRWLDVGIALLFLLKLAGAAAAFQLWAQLHWPHLKGWGVALGLSYALCCYSFAYGLHIMWLDALLLAPLLCIGVDRLLQCTAFPVLYAAALGFILWANFYIGWMVCLFIVLYFLAGVVLLPKAQRTGPQIAGSMARFAAGSVVGALLAAPVLLPAVADIAAAKGAGRFVFSPSPRFSLARLPERFVWGSFTTADTARDTFSPLLYCGALVLLLALCFFVLPKARLSLRERLTGGGLLLAVFLSLYITGFDRIWHGFSDPIGFHSRQAFLLVLVLCMLAARALAALTAGPPPLRTLCLGLGLFASLMVVAVVARSVTPAKILLTFGAACAYAALLYVAPRLAARAGTTGNKQAAEKTEAAANGQSPAYAKNAGTTPGRKAAKGVAPQKARRLAALCMVVLALATGGELALNGFYTYRQYEAYTHSGYQRFVDGTQATLAALPGMDSGIRIEKNYFRSLNDPMLFGYSGISHWSSVMDEGASLLYPLGYRGYGIYQYGSTAFADSLLGIRYVYGRQPQEAPPGTTDAPVPAHFVPAGLDVPEPLWQNPYALPRAFTVPAGGAAVNLWSTDNSFAVQNDIYNALGGAGQILQPVVATAADGTGNPLPATGRRPAGSRYSVTASADGYYYALLTAPALYGLPITINGAAAGTYLAADHYGVVNLGHYRTGEAIELGLGNGVEIEITGAWFACTPDAALQSWTETARAGAAELQWGQSAASGTVTAAPGRTELFLSVPYDSNWHCTVNGQRVQPLRLAGGFLGLPLKAGENTIHIEYRAPLAKTGLWLGCGAGLLLLGLWALPKARRNKNKTGKGA